MQVTFDEKFFEQLLQFLTLEAEAFTAAVDGKVPEPTRTVLIRANEVEVGRGNDHDFSLMNSGSVPLAFEGAILAEQSGSWHRGKQINRYVDLRIYMTAAKTYVGQIVFRTAWPGETDRHSVFYGTLRECLETFEKYVPSRELVGIGFPNPENKQFKARQERLMVLLDTLYKDRLSRLVEALPMAQVAKRIE
jgi:hypothetical protein